MTLKEACDLWINRDFSMIPTGLIKKAFKDCPEELELLSSEDPTLDNPAAWGWMWHPDCSLDEIWIRENVDLVERCGFLIYDSEETGILLGVDGCGYSFEEEHFQPLYKMRGLRWHK
jgi:hypothetical protein